jgi:hypothetical protein
MTESGTLAVSRREKTRSGHGRALREAVVSDDTMRERSKKRNAGTRDVSSLLVFATPPMTATRSRLTYSSRDFAGCLRWASTLVLARSRVHGPRAGKRPPHTFLRTSKPARSKGNEERVLHPTTPRAFAYSLLALFSMARGAHEATLHAHSRHVLNRVRVISEFDPSSMSLPPHLLSRHHSPAPRIT